MTAAEAASQLASKGSGTKLPEFRGESAVAIDREKLVDALAYAKDELGFDYLVDVCAVDNSGEDPRFEVVYHLYSLAEKIGLRVKTTCPEDDAVVPSVSGLWPTANWHEREAWDMMGIDFQDHPDLRRILMWEGYPYFPLRKEFPLAGKSSDVPDVAFTEPAPLAGGPFVSLPSDAGTDAREPRSRE